MNSLRLALICAAITLAWTQPVRAESDDSAALTHPGDTDPVYRAAQSDDPFALAVPMLTRDVASPSYAPAPSGAPAAEKAEAEAMPDMDHGGMDHGNMTH
ncbi:hypothetical protein [Dongia sp.]|uniref:hypothetical protein n=1 Tax=Dongia sp. TaxID=1977262 RepID=UPI0037531E98